MYVYVLASIVVCLCISFNCCFSLPIISQLILGSDTSPMPCSWSSEFSTSRVGLELMPGVSCPIPALGSETFFEPCLRALCIFERLEKWLFFLLPLWSSEDTCGTSMVLFLMFLAVEALARLCLRWILETFISLSVSRVNPAGMKLRAAFLATTGKPKCDGRAEIEPMPVSS